MRTSPARLAVSLEPLEARIAPATIYGISDGTDNSSVVMADKLISFDAATPAVFTTVSLTGFVVGGTTEHIRGIDFRPATGEMYALGIVHGGATDIGRVYTLDPASGQLTALNGGAPFFSTFNQNDDYAFDIDPAADALRVLGDAGRESLRVDPKTGALVLQDTNLPNDALLDGVAYDHNFAGTAVTTLYGIDTLLDRVVMVGGLNGNPSPNLGGVTAVGPLGFDINNYKVGFDIEAHTKIGYATFRPNGGVPGLYTVDYLGTGAATLVGAIGGAPDFEGMTVSLDDLKIVNPTTATYTDQDGDHVTVKITGAKPGAALSKSDFKFATGEFGSQLQLLNFSDDGQEWAKANISINAVPLKTGNVTRGDSFANVGYINATGVDLGNVTINGDLGQIDAGDATKTTPGLASLTVQSMGVFANTQIAGSSSPLSNIVGKLGSLTVKSDMVHANISVDGDIGPVKITGNLDGRGVADGSGIDATGAIGTVTLGGSLYGGTGLGVGEIFSTSMGAVTVKGSIYGGTASSTGYIHTGSSMGAVTVGGSLFGGDGLSSGVIDSSKDIGAVLIKGSIVGGTGDLSGYLNASGLIASLKINGSILGGSTPGSIDQGYVNAHRAGPVTVGGNLEGGASTAAGTLSLGSAKSVTIGGFIKGGSGSTSGSILGGSALGPVKIAGDAIGDSSLRSGSIITTKSGGNIASVTIGGSFVGGRITADGQLGAVKITGDLRSGRITGQGLSEDNDPNTPPLTAAKALAIKSLSVGGSVLNSRILGGPDSQSGAVKNGDAGLGAVTVGGNWIASSIVAGITNYGADHDSGGGDDDLSFGNSDDHLISLGTPSATVLSAIASITIKGFATGTLGGADTFGFIAQQIGAVKVGARTYTLAPGTDPIGFALGNTGDLIVREVP